MILKNGQDKTLSQILDEIHSETSHNAQQMQRVLKILDGNGREGITDRMARMEQNYKNCQALGRIHRSGRVFYVMIIGIALNFFLSAFSITVMFFDAIKPLLPFFKG